MSCPCTQPTAVVPPLVKLIRAGTTPTSSCAMGQPYETLSITTFVPQAVAATQTVAVCSAASYLIGTCVLLVDSSGNTQVQRVTGHVGTDTLTLTAYTNDYSDTTTTLTGVIYMQPVGICPPDTTSVTECFRTYAETLDAFVMPAEDGTVEVTFTEAVSFPYGAEVYIDGAGWMMVDNPPTGGFVACSESHYMTNLGTVGNATPGATITGGAYVTIDRAPVDTFTPTSGEVVKVFSDGEYHASSIDHSDPGFLEFTIPWAADLDIRWRVGHPVTPTNNDGHSHWELTLDSVPTVAVVAISNVWNDADLSGYEAASNWGNVVVSNKAAGTYKAAIRFLSLSGDAIPLLDTWYIQVIAHRKQTSVS